MNLNHKVLQDWADDFVPAFTELREARLRRSTIQAAGHCVLTVVHLHRLCDALWTNATTSLRRRRCRLRMTLMPGGAYVSEARSRRRRSQREKVRASPHHILSARL
jgi:hypothetical protein